MAKSESRATPRLHLSDASFHFLLSSEGPRRKLGTCAADQIDIVTNAKTTSSTTSMPIGQTSAWRKELEGNISACILNPRPCDFAWLNMHAPNVGQCIARRKARRTCSEKKTLLQKSAIQKIGASDEASAIPMHTVFHGFSMLF